MFRTLRRLLLILGAGLLALSRVQAQEVLYGASGSNGVAGNLYIIDPYTAAATLVGPITNSVGGGGIGITGLAFDPLSGLLYGITSNGTGGNTLASRLVIINPETAVATVVGPLGFANSDISFRSDGTLYGYEAGGTTTGNRSMTTINLSTGAATKVGTAFTGALTAGGGLAFSPNGTLYLSATNASGTLDTLDPATGFRTVGPSFFGAPIPGSANGAMNAMACNAAGTLFAVNSDRVGPSPAVASSFLVTIDPASGGVTPVGTTVNLPDNMDGLAFSPVGNKQIQIVSKVGSTATITVGSNTGYTYQLQRSSTLLPGSFTNIGSSQAGTGGTLTFIDSTATGPADFYRVLISHGPQANPGPLNAGRHPANLGPLKR
jgi:hypothetical protein